MITDRFILTFDGRVVGNFRKTGGQTTLHHIRHVESIEIVQKKKGRKLLKINLVEGHLVADDIKPEDMRETEEFIVEFNRAKAAIQSAGREP